MSYLADYHTHSVCSPDGSYSAAEMAEAAVKAGIQELCITDHVDTYFWDTGAPRRDYDWDKISEQYARAQKQWGGKIKIKLGCELGDAQIGFDRADHLLDTAPALDFVIGSVHLQGSAYGGQDLYYIKKGDEAFYYGVIEDYLNEMQQVAAWGRCNVLGHLSLPLRYINEKYGLAITYDKHMDHVEQVLRTALERGVGIECNTNRGNEPLPGEKVLKLYRQLGGEIITLGSDAHSPEYVGCAIKERQELLKSCGFRYFTTFTRGKPEFHSL